MDDPGSPTDPPPPPDVPAILGPRDVPPEAWLAVARMPKKMWPPVLELLEDFRVRRAHGIIHLRLIESWGRASDFKLRFSGTLPNPR